MSAGAVLIRHHPESRVLRIEKTKGAVWETGVWENPEADEIRSLLREVMNEYRGLVEYSQSEGLALSADPPHFEITWPMRIGLQAADYGLPSRANITLVDLPGFKYVGDDLNSKVIEKWSKGLCLVTYNSAEIDSKKQNILLRQIVDQVKTLGGSPARMLFILNRIDMFLQDDNPDVEERKFTQKVTNRIRSEISDALPNFNAEANAIEPTPLSTEPALFALLAEASSDLCTKISYLDKLEETYMKLFPRSRLLKLPRDKEGWSAEDREWFIAEAKRGARLPAFEARLKQHIAVNFPEILLPDLVTAAYTPARKALQAMDAIAQSYTLATRDEVEAAAQRLDDLYVALKKLAEKGSEALMQLKELADASKQIPSKWYEELYDVVHATEEELGLGDAALAPIASASFDTVYPPIRRLNVYVRKLDTSKNVAVLAAN
jgi:hypothetical protein